MLLLLLFCRVVIVILIIVDIVAVAVFCCRRRLVAFVDKQFDQRDSFSAYRPLITKTTVFVNLLSFLSMLGSYVIDNV